jgi:hypothetical protein
MNTRVRTKDPAAVLRKRLEALVSQLMELEKLRERVGREPSTQAALERAIAVAEFGRRAVAAALRRSSSRLYCLVAIKRGYMRVVREREPAPGACPDYPAILLPGEREVLRAGAP